MTQPNKPMTTSEFAKATGIPTAAVSKLIRDGKIKAKKEGRAWMIPASQLESSAIREVGEVSKAGKPRKSFKANSPFKAAKASEPEGVEPKPHEQPASVAAPEADTTQTAGEPAPPEKSYSIPEFAAMTYLTDWGVSEWLRTGKLRGCKTETGEWRVLESNLNVPNISRLVRK
jgi:excisionase family DNA binding protein